MYVRKLFICFIQIILLSFINAGETVVVERSVVGDIVYGDSIKDPQDCLKYLAVPLQEPSGWQCICTNGTLFSSSIDEVPICYDGKQSENSK